MNIKKSLSLILAALLVSSALFSCEDKGSDASDETSGTNPSITLPTPGGSVSTDDEVNAGTIPTVDEDTPVEVPESAKIINKLTGLETTEELSNQRPVAVMINNIKAAIPQVGISNMDIIYEITVEGAITRLLGVCTDWASLPVIGSVRSSRDYFIDISDAHNAIYVHAGGSDYAYNVLWTRGTERIDGTNGTYASGKAFYRDSHRRNDLKMAIEHTLVTNGEKLATAIAANGFSTTYKEGFEAPFIFNKEVEDFEGDDASYIYIPFSRYAQSYLDYDEKTKLYSKGQYLSSRSSLNKHDSPHIDETTGEALTFTNVLVMYADHSDVAGDKKGRISVNFTGMGNGYYMSHGKCKAIIWKKESRTSGYTLYEADGTTPLKMNPGKSYVAIVPKTSEIVYN